LPAATEYHWAKRRPLRLPSPVPVAEFGSTARAATYGSTTMCYVMVLVDTRVSNRFARSMLLQIVGTEKGGAMYFIEVPHVFSRAF
jgi:hypothetical protein